MGSAFILKDLVIPLIQFIVVDMGIALGDLDILMPCECLGKFEISRGAQDRRNKVVPEGVGGDMSLCLISQCLSDSFGNYIAAGCRRDRLDLFSCPFVVSGEEGQGSQLFS